MRLELIITINLLTLCLFGQTSDSLEIGKQIIEEYPQICDIQSKLIRHGEIGDLTKEDSINNCRYIIIYETNFNEIYFQKEFNLFDTLIAEGPVTKTRNKKKIFQKRTYSFYKNGLWKEYDYISKEIQFIQYSQGNCKRGGWNIHIWKKTEKMK